MSTIPTLKANLKAALDTLAATNGNALYQVAIGYGATIHGNPREWIWIGDVVGDQAFAALGAQRREESYELTCIAFCAQEGDNQQAVSERAFAMAAAVETWLRANPTVNSAVRVAGFGGHIALEERASDDGKRRGALVTFTVTCHARI